MYCLVGEQEFPRNLKDLAYSHVDVDLNGVEEWLRLTDLVEAVVQLRGEAGDRQIPNAKMTMSHGMGGLFATHGVLLLEAT